MHIFLLLEAIEAFTISQDSKKGEVHIDLPKCILSDKMEYFNIDKTHYMSKMKLIKEDLKINNSTNILFINSEGDTDKEVFLEIINSSI